MNLDSIFAPVPMNAYPTFRPRIDEQHFQEWVERKARCVHCLTPEEWTLLEAEYRKEHGIGS